MKLFISDIQEQFIDACRQANIAKMRYFLTSDKLLNHADINYKGEALFAGCAYRHFEVVKYLLCSPDLKEHADITYRNNMSSYCFNIACSYGLLDIVQFMVESPLLSTHATMNQSTLCHACVNNQIEIISYLSTKFSFDQYFTISTLKTIIDMNNEEILKFFIEQCGLRCNEEILNFLNEPYVAPSIQYIGGQSHYLQCELFKKKAKTIFSY